MRHRHQGCRAADAVGRHGGRFPYRRHPPEGKADDVCPTDQDLGRVSREQGLRAWASALAATLPPLTSSQAAAVARIAARLDARNGQEPAA